MATTKTTFTYRVTGVTEAGVDRLNVALTQVVESPADPSVPNYGNGLNLNLTSDEAKAFWPGQEFTMTLAPVSTS